MSIDELKASIISAPDSVKDVSAILIRDPKKAGGRLRLLKSKAKPPPDEDLDEGTLPRQDVGRSDMFVAQHKDRVCYVRGIGWFAWDGKRWRYEGKEVLNLIPQARATVETIWDAACKTSGFKRESLAKFYSQSRGHQSLVNMIKLSRRALTVDPNQFDQDPFLLNCQNGTLDVRTLKLKKHDPRDYMAKICLADYDPKAKAPVFERWLRTTFDNDQEIIDFLQRSVGYSLTGDQREKCFWILHGPTNSGKGTLMEVLLDVLGREEYARPVRRELLIKDHSHNPSSREDFFVLRGSRLVVASEADEHDQLNEAQVKNICGNDTLVSRALYSEQSANQPTHHAWLQVNDKPQIPSQDPATWGRLRLIKFPIRFVKPGEEVPGDQKTLPMDKQLRDKLRKELPGVLLWSVRGANAWFNKGRPNLREPQCVLDEIKQYRENENIVGKYIDDRCERGPDFFVETSILYGDFADWLREQDRRVWTKDLFSKRLSRPPNKFELGKDAQGNRCVFGLRLITQKTLTEKMTKELDNQRPKTTARGLSRAMKPSRTREKITIIKAAGRRPSPPPSLKTSVPLSDNEIDRLARLAKVAAMRPPDPSKRGRGEDAT
jgi:putative DNA primase/helicase